MTVIAMTTDRPGHSTCGEGAYERAAQAERLALSAGQVEQFHREGYLVVEGVVTGAALDELRGVTDEFLERARELDASDEAIDLAPDHTRECPQVRRIMDPDRHHPVYEAATRMPEILDVICDLLGPDIRFDHSKLNCKPPRGGIPIEWHQDWGFYPQTNDSMLALSLMLDDCGLDNGPLLVIPGSHRGPTWDHHYQGSFIGAIDPATAGFDESSALALTGPAGSVAIHQVRTVHGSADSTSGRQRRLLNMNYATTATWPLLGLDTILAMTGPGIEAFHATTVRGKPTIEPRMESLPVRIPLPAADARTIFDLQRPAYGRSFRRTAPRAASAAAQ
jgi:ectoine hydroxylase-related dioxygenase (phytanoyl-CoA dioxygenase family)